MAANQHHLSVKIELGCGCRFERRFSGEDIVHQAEENAEELGVELPDLFTFPSGIANLFGMILSLYDSHLLAMIISEQHQDNGNESIDIRIRTKVGELPTPEEWRALNE